MPTFKIEYGLEGKAVSHGLWGGKWCDCFVIRGGNLLSQRVTENRPKIEGGRWSGELILFQTVVLRQAGIHFWALERDRKRVSEGVLDAGKYRIRTGIGVKISYAELRLVGEDCWPASGILMNCAGDRDSPRFVSIAKLPCLGRRRVAPTASYEIETRRYADT